MTHLHEATNELALLKQWEDSWNIWIEVEIENENEEEDLDSGEEDEEGEEAGGDGVLCATDDMCATDEGEDTETGPAGTAAANINENMFLPLRNRNGNTKNGVSRADQVQGDTTEGAGAGDTTEGDDDGSGAGAGVPRAPSPSFSFLQQAEQQEEDEHEVEEQVQQERPVNVKTQWVRRFDFTSKPGAML